MKHKLKIYWEHFWYYERVITKLASINRRSIYRKRRGFYKNGRMKTGWIFSRTTWVGSHRTKTGCLIRKLMRLKTRHPLTLKV
jgi:hypothetical protein